LTALHAEDRAHPEFVRGAVHRPCKLKGSSSAHCSMQSRSVSGHPQSLLLSGVSLLSSVLEQANSIASTINASNDATNDFLPDSGISIIFILMKIQCSWKLYFDFQVENVAPAKFAWGYISNADGLRNRSLVLLPLCTANRRQDKRLDRHSLSRLSRLSRLKTVPMCCLMILRCSNRQPSSLAP
jgi:hypothetical protein